MQDKYEMSDAVSQSAFIIIEFFLKIKMKKIVYQVYVYISR